MVRDLFFVARIRETARLAGVPVTFAKDAEELERMGVGGARLVLVDLTASLDRDRLFEALVGERPPVLGFTTHALARETQPWHERCDRVVTKEALTRELPDLLRSGVGP